MINEAVDLIDMGNATRVTMTRTHQRHGLPELIVGVLGIEEHTLHANLQRFKQHAELLAAAGDLERAAGDAAR